MISISVDIVREVGPRDPWGASSYRIDPGPVAFTGAPLEAMAFLRSVPGYSVTVRHAGGLRSCMSTPKLWAWIETLADC